MEAVPDMDLLLDALEEEEDEVKRDDRAEIDEKREENHRSSSLTDHLRLSKEREEEDEEEKEKKECEENDDPTLNESVVEAVIESVVAVQIDIPMNRDENCEMNTEGVSDESTTVDDPTEEEQFDPTTEGPTEQEQFDAAISEMERYLTECKADQLIDDESGDQVNESFHNKEDMPDSVEVETVTVSNQNETSLEEGEITLLEQEQTLALLISREQEDVHEKEDNQWMPIETDRDSHLPIEREEEVLQTEESSTNSVTIAIEKPSIDSVTIEKEEPPTDSVAIETEKPSTHSVTIETEEPPTDSVTIDCAGGQGIPPQGGVDKMHLTESELQLGKYAPNWIPDRDCDSCMLCSTKFTLLLRRHHCRACGRVVCHHCCAADRARLPYIKDPKKLERICAPCSVTLQRIAQLESQHDEDVDTPSSSNASEINRAKSALKGKTEDSNVAIKRSVTFLDGVNPGADIAIDETREPVTKLKKKGMKRAVISLRVLELRIEEERTSLLPKDDENDQYWRRNIDGQLEQMDRTAMCQSMGTNEPVHIAIKRNFIAVVQICNLHNVGFGRVFCISTRGMMAIGMDEVFVAFEMLQDEEPWVPDDVLHALERVFTVALERRLEATKSEERLGIRRVATRLDPLVLCDDGVPAGRVIKTPTKTGLLLFRPSVQFMDVFPVPTDPYFICAIVSEAELMWAMALPNRLLYRIGLHCSYYPTPIINKRNRPPVFGAVGHLTVLKVFTDFRNWSYRIPRIAGSKVFLSDDETVIVVPNWAIEQMRNLVESNRNMMAWATDFNEKCDSHLVCEQTDNGAYRTQVISMRGKTRKVTGASFVIIDGALKTAECNVQANVVEDGVAIRLRPEALTELAECLCQGRDFVRQSPSMTFRLEWNRTIDDKGEPFSPIDRKSLMGCWQYGVDQSRLLTSINVIPGVAEWALRLSAVYNLDEARPVAPMESKMFSICEQIAAQVAVSMSPFVRSLIRRNMNIAVRVQLTAETAEYQTGQWMDMTEEHSLWMSTLDEMLVPSLYNFCSYVTGFHVELHLAIVSTRPLPI